MTQGPKRSTDGPEPARDERAVGGAGTYQLPLTQPPPVPWHVRVTVPLVAP